jgi:hypothetical protein
MYGGLWEIGLGLGVANWIRRDWSPRPPSSDSEAKFRMGLFPVSGMETWTWHTETIGRVTTSAGVSRRREA